MPENCPKYLYINSPNPEFKADTIILIFTDEKLKQESIKYLGVWFQGSSFEPKGIFHANVGTIKERNGMDLTEAEDIKKRWQEYTELYKKDLHDPDNHDGCFR